MRGPIQIAILEPVEGASAFTPFNIQGNLDIAPKKNVAANFSPDCYFWRHQDERARQAPFGAAVDTSGISIEPLSSPRRLVSARSKVEMPA